MSTIYKCIYIQYSIYTYKYIYIYTRAGNVSHP